MKTILTILTILIFYSTISFSQISREFLINDKDKIISSSKYFVKISVPKLIAESNYFGYSLHRNENGDFLLYDNKSAFWFIIIKKDINIDDFYSEKFPNYYVGSIYKKICFFGDVGLADTSKSKIFKIITEIRLHPGENLSTSQIQDFYNDLKNDLNYYYKNDFDTSEPLYKLNYKGILGDNYDILVARNIKNKETNEYSYSISVGEYDGDEYNTLTFILQNSGINQFYDALHGIDSSIKNLRFWTGNKNMRKINEFDLEAMVNFFLDDCRSNYIKVPKTYTLNCSFEQLEGNTIAQSYGWGNDSLIKIKVDPIKWRKSSLEEKWYVLYHELGHDVLNLDHGQGGKMMFNFVDKEYTWDDFFNDKNYMFSSIHK